MTVTASVAAATNPRPARRTRWPGPAHGRELEAGTRRSPTGGAPRNTLNGRAGRSGCAEPAPPGGRSPGAATSAGRVAVGREGERPSPSRRPVRGRNGRVPGRARRRARHRRNGGRADASAVNGGRIADAAAEADQALAAARATGAVQPTPRGACPAPAGASRVDASMRSTQGLGREGGEPGLRLRRLPGASPREPHHAGIGGRGSGGRGVAAVPGGARTCAHGGRRGPGGGNRPRPPRPSAAPCGRRRRHCWVGHTTHDTHLSPSAPGGSGRHAQSFALHRETRACGGELEHDRWGCAAVSAAAVSRPDVVRVTEVGVTACADVGAGLGLLRDLSSSASTAPCLSTQITTRSPGLARVMACRTARARRARSRPAAAGPLGHPGRTPSATARRSRRARDPAGPRPRGP